jgi:drug/metabolite transporter (DMT)-like permease
MPRSVEPAVAAPRLLAAAGAMIAASAILALTTLLAKALGRGMGGEGLHPLQVSAGRFGFALAWVAVAAAVARPALAGTPWRVHTGRSLCGWLGVSCMFAAAALMPLAEATAISFLSPIVAVALAVIFLRERPGAVRWAAVAIAFVGALLLIRPGTAAFQPAALLALGAALFLGAEAVLVKHLTGGEPRLRILLVNNAIGTALAVTAAAFVWTTPTAGQWGLLALLGSAMLTAQMLFIAAMRRGEASYVMPFFYATLVFASLYDVALFGERPDLAGALGAGVIVAGAVLLALAERRGR